MLDPQPGWYGVYGGKVWRVIGQDDGWLWLRRGAERTSAPATAVLGLEAAEQAERNKRRRQARRKTQPRIETDGRP